MEHGINLDLINSIQWFQQNGMIANPDKYHALVLGNTAHDFEIKCEENPIPVSSEIELLGATLENKLKFDSNIASICRKAGLYNYELKIITLKKLLNYNNGNFRKLHDKYFLNIPLCRPCRKSNPVAHSMSLPQSPEKT